MENMEIKNILVTGSEGYIGSVLVQKLLEKEYNIQGIDTLFFSVLHDTKPNGYVLTQKDIREITKEDLQGVDAIIHLAALSNDASGEINSKLTTAINYKATVQLAKKAKKAGVKRFIFSSSCSVYGISKSGVVDEKSATNPLTEYAKSKILSEKVLQKLADSKFTVVLMRNATVYGYSPAFRNDLVVNNLVSCALALGEIRIKSDGTPWRPLIDVKDLSEIMIRFLTIPSNKINGKIINVGFNENNFQVKDILNIIQKKLPQCTITYTKEHGSDTRSYQVNFDMLTKIMPTLTQQWPIEKSVEDLIANLKRILFTKEHFQSGKYERLTKLRSLLTKKEVNENLFWR